ncbi:MAG TPA: DUF72 domain-containing protein [Terriglobales bacterium]|nr:DUF72 domain-containing protein [Terriglobales bacterium]
MARIYAGTSGWAYATWKPDFYPAKLPASRFLQHYASQLNSVEVNYTFRTLLSEKLARRWLEATPAEFTFSLKAHQMFTHLRRLQPDADFTRRFFTCITPLAQEQRLGAVLFQLPPNLKGDAPLLRAFLDSLPKGFRAAFEFRHQSWFSEAVFDTLKQFGAALCVAESDDFETPDVPTAGFAYYRLRKESYSPARRKALAEHFVNLRAAGRDVYAYYKHEDTPEGALHARELLQAAG